MVQLTTSLFSRRKKRNISGFFTLHLKMCSSGYQVAVLRHIAVDHPCRSIDLQANMSPVINSKKTKARNRSPVPMRLLLSSTAELTAVVRWLKLRFRSHCHELRQTGRRRSDASRKKWKLVQRLCRTTSEACLLNSRSS